MNGSIRLELRFLPASVAIAALPLMQATIMTAALSGILLAAPSLAVAGAALATTEGETAGVKLEVQELKVSNGVVMMKFTVTNESKAPVDGMAMADRENLTKDYHDVSGAYLVDTANKKKYLVIRDSDNQCLCSRNLGGVAPGTAANLWARFPAPPDNVQKIGVVVPHFIPMDDVPLTR
jgi:hypothetical protein